jgi:hypothetical protein
MTRHSDKRLPPPVSAALATILERLKDAVGIDVMVSMARRGRSSLYTCLKARKFSENWANAVVGSIIDRQRDPPKLRSDQVEILHQCDRALRRLFKATEGFRRCEHWSEDDIWSESDEPRKDVAIGLGIRGNLGRSEMPGDIPRAVEAGVGLASMSAGYDRHNSPPNGRSLLVTLNTFVEKLTDDETGQEYAVQLATAELDLSWEGSIHDPLGWQAAEPQTVGDREVTIEFTGAPPKIARWRLSNLHLAPSGGSFDSEYFGVITGDAGSDDSLCLKVCLTDLVIDLNTEQEATLSEKSLQKRRVWAQLLRKAAIGQVQTEIVAVRQPLPGPNG